ncbi:hypothetical protein HMPREF9103_00400 [Lentilactobacillus parafarraginis F0439]|uniref:Uncharacterized protein n=1 Tax=Lentilactobacillus parafarraginis F0439 TaxID=797515 RepID=G9ZL02_9LACO|nr:hypothetical protein HMPREF9103_00400 [Lentilactobacillus parafarraginis F0439]
MKRLALKFCVFSKKSLKKSPPLALTMISFLTEAVFKGFHLMF